MEVFSNTPCRLCALWSFLLKQLPLPLGVVFTTPIYHLFKIQIRNLHQAICNGIRLVTIQLLPSLLFTKLPQQSPKNQPLFICCYS